MKTWLKCYVSPGMFPDEFAVGGQQYNGKPFSLFAPASTVRPPELDRGEGSVQVEIWERKGNLVLVRLPQQTLENGYYVTVNSEQLQV